MPGAPEPTAYRKKPGGDYRRISGDPLIIDTTGSGFALTTLAESKAYFARP